MSTNTVVYWGTGRRKTAVARVRVVPGTGTVTINGRPGDNYLNYNPVYLAAVNAPLQTLGLASEYDLLVNVRGGAGCHHHFSVADHLGIGVPGGMDFCLRHDRYGAEERKRNQRLEN